MKWIRDSQPAKFLIAGGIAAAVNIGSRFFYSEFFSLSAAVICAYLTGMITAFVLTRLFVFTPTQTGTAQSAFRFTVVNALAVLQTWAVTLILGESLLPAAGVTENIAIPLAHTIGVIVPVFTSYIGHKHWSFR